MRSHYPEILDTVARQLKIARTTTKPLRAPLRSTLVCLDGVIPGWNQATQVWNRSRMRVMGPRGHCQRHSTSRVGTPLRRCQARAEVRTARTGGAHDAHVTADTRQHSGASSLTEARAREHEGVLAASEMGRGTIARFKSSDVSSWPALPAVSAPSHHSRVGRSRSVDHEGAQRAQDAPSSQMAHRHLSWREMPALSRRTGSRAHPTGSGQG